MMANQSSGDTPGADRLTWGAFVLMAILAGGSTVAVRMSNSGLPPFWGATLRLGTAALVFWIIVLLRGIPLPRARALRGAVLYGLLSMGLSYAGMYWGLTRAPASLAGAMLAFVPLLTFFCAWAHGLEKFRSQGLIGTLVATAGVVFGVVGGFGGAMHVPSVLALLAGVTCMAEGTVVFKLFPRSHPVATNAVALTTGTLPLALLSLLTGERWTLPTTLNSWAAYGYLVLIGSVVVFSLGLHILSRWTASAASYVFLLMPVSSVVIAALLLGEAITLSLVIGTALVVAGVWLGAIHEASDTADVACDQMPSTAAC